jgi:Phage integrase family
VHDLRHTCGSWLIHAGVPLPVVQQHLGRENINTPIKAYCHLDRSSTKATADVIGKMLHLKSTLALLNSVKAISRLIKNVCRTTCFGMTLGVFLCSVRCCGEHLFDRAGFRADWRSFETLARQTTERRTFPR